MPAMSYAESMTLDTLKATVLTTRRSPVVSLPPIAADTTHAVDLAIGADPGSSPPPTAVAAPPCTTDATSVGGVLRALHMPPAGAVRRG